MDILLPPASAFEPRVNEGYFSLGPIVGNRRYAQGSFRATRKRMGTKSVSDFFSEKCAQKPAPLCSTGGAKGHGLPEAGLRILAFFEKVRVNNNFAISSVPVGGIYLVSGLLEPFAKENVSRHNFPNSGV